MEKGIKRRESVSFRRCFITFFSPPELSDMMMFGEPKIYGEIKSSLVSTGDEEQNRRGSCEG